MAGARRPRRGRSSRAERYDAGRRSVSSASVVREVAIPFPAVLKKDPTFEASSVALVDVEGDRLKLRFLHSPVLADESASLTTAEQAVLAKDGVEPVSEELFRIVSARDAAARERLRATSLSVEQVSRRLGVNASRVRQRLAERSLYGFKEGNTWLLPSFQFLGNGLVPGVDVVLRSLPPDVSPLGVVQWFNIPNPDLYTRDDEERAQTPLRWLLAGNPPGPAAALAAEL